MSLLGMVVVMMKMKMIGWEIRREREKVATLPMKRRLGRMVLLLVLVLGTSSRIGRHPHPRRSRMIWLDGLDELIQAFWRRDVRLVGRVKDGWMMYGCIRRNLSVVVVLATGDNAETWLWHSPNPKACCVYLRTDIFGTKQTPQKKKKKRKVGIHIATG